MLELFSIGPSWMSGSRDVGNVFSFSGRSSIFKYGAISSGIGAIRTGKDD
jgi:hypothetical protein